MDNASSLPNSSASVLSECRNMKAMTMASGADSTSAIGVRSALTVVCVGSAFTIVMPWAPNRFRKMAVTSAAVFCESAGYDSNTSGFLGFAPFHWRPPSMAIEETGV